MVSPQQHVNTADCNTRKRQGTMDIKKKEREIRGGGEREMGGGGNCGYI